MSIEERLAALEKATRRWRLATCVLFLLFCSVLAMGLADAPHPVWPKPEHCGGFVVQPSNNVQATALAIAYHAVRTKGPGVPDRIPPKGDLNHPKGIVDYAEEILKQYRHWVGPSPHK